MSRDQTLDFYAREAETYAARSVQSVSAELGTFMARLPNGARVLELGCGAGRDSEALVAAGFDVTPTDGAAEMAAIAQRRLGRPVQVLRFEDLAEVAAYDGIWANASLLHVPRQDLEPVIVKIHRALRSNGLFYASYKTGGEAGYDRFGRYYNRPDPEWLRQMYGAGLWAEIQIAREHAPGYFGEPSDWLCVAAIKA